MPHDETMTDSFDLQRFVAAQASSYGTALAELRTGQKRSHWMWFIFPQLRELGQSKTARFFGIASADEARAYLTHSLLGSRLRECCAALLLHRDRPAEAIMGSIDALKLRSSMTLFEAVADDHEPFAEVLDTFYGGVRDPATLALLSGD